MAAVTHHYLVPRSKGLAPSLGLAIVMHGLLALMLVLGLSWHSTTPTVIEAELWSALPQMAAPATEPPPKPVVEPPKPVVVPEPEPAPLPKPDITIKAETPKKEPPPRPSPPPPAPVPRPAPTKASDLAYIQQQLTHETTGTAERSAGPKGDDNYLNRLTRAIQPHVIFPPPPGVTGNPTVTLSMQLLPTGEVTSVTVVTSSGLPAFDAAVQRGVEAASPLPRNSEGVVPRSMTLDYRLFPNRPAN